MENKILLNRLEKNQFQAAEEIRKYRNEECLTQEYIAKKLGVTQSTYQRIESGKISLSFDRLKKIAAILNRPIDFFTNRKPKINSEFVEVNKKEWEMLQKLVKLQNDTIALLECRIEDYKKSHI